MEIYLRALTAICFVAIELFEVISSMLIISIKMLSFSSSSAIADSCAKFPAKRQALHCMLSFTILCSTNESFFTIPRQTT